MLNELLDSARKAREQAYCPSSRFPVGAALLTSDNEIFAGCNVENLSFGLTVCAERTALFSAMAAGKRQFSGMVLLTDTPEPVTPCGACRQALYEFSPNLWIVTQTCMVSSAYTGSASFCLMRFWRKFKQT